MFDFILCICACVLSYILSTILYRPTHTPAFQNMSTRGGIAVILSSVVCVAASVLSTVSVAENIFFPVLLWALGLSLYGLTSHRLNRFWTYLLICGLTAFALPPSWVFFHGAVPFWAERLIITLVWALSLHISATLNALPVLMPAFIRLQLITLILLNLWTPNLQLAWVLAICLGAQIGFSFYARKKPFLRQGKSGIVPARYLMGFFWLQTVEAAPVARGGLWLACLVAYSYMLWEVCYSFAYRWIFRKKQEPKMLSFFFVQAVQRHLDKSAEVTRFFSNRWSLLILFAVVLGILRAPAASLLWPTGLVLLIVFAEIYLQIKAFSGKVTSTTSMFSVIPMCKDIFAGYKELFRKIKDK